MTLDPEEAMRQLVDSLDLPEADPSTNVCLLDEAELVTRFQKVTRALIRSDQAVNPTTPAGRDLHSERSAYLVEMKRRGLR